MYKSLLKIVGKLFIISFIVCLWNINKTETYFSDSAVISGTTFSTGYWAKPVISNIEYLIATPGEENAPTATITWNTDIPATSNLEWKKTGETIWQELSLDTTADNTSHSREITGLIPSTKYYFKVKSADSNGNETVSDIQTFKTGDIRWGMILSNIVINEFLPNPIGNDNDLMPNGEWIEIYNRGNTPKNLTGWYLTDGQFHKLEITSQNSLPSSLTIPPHGFLVVYRNGDKDFDLSNKYPGDSLMLFNSSGWLKDVHIYSCLFGDQILENKSFARFPDGSHTWFDPIPTPGSANILEDPEISLNLVDYKSIFSVTHLENYLHIKYVLTYKTEELEQGVIGEKDLNNQLEFTRDNIILGTCTSNGMCVYHENITDLKLTVTLTDWENNISTLEKSL